MGDFVTLATLQDLGVWGGGKTHYFWLNYLSDDLATLATSQNWGKQKKKNPKTLKPQNPTAAGAAELRRIFFKKPRNKCIALKLPLMTATAVATRDQHHQSPTTFLSPPPS